MIGKVSAGVLKRWLSDGGEIALLDVREMGQHAAGHPLFAVPVPYSRFECRVPGLVPNRSVRTVLLDDDDGVAARAASSLAAMGYSEVSVFEGGAAAWSAAGYTLFDGLNVPSKAFGELVEIRRRTPRITAAELSRRQRAGEEIAVIDGRPFREFQKMSVPGGRCCPNGELALRIAEMVPDERTPIVVNCAGRTRSIIGAQTLIDFGVPNPVAALENGTQGWFLAGLELEHGSRQGYPPIPHSGRLAALRARALAMAQRAGVRIVTAAEVRTFLADGGRTTYLFDVRTAEEHGRDGVDALVHAPGGQLVQALDHWVAVQGARIVVVDDELVRAPVTASWLVKLGYDACVLEDGVRGAEGIIRPREASPRADDVAPVEDLAAFGPASLAGAQVVDLRRSMDFRASHLEAAVWCVRPRLGRLRLRSRAPVVLVTGDDEVAALCARDLRRSGLSAPIRQLRGAPEDWRRAGMATVASGNRPPDEDCIDFVFHTHDRHSGNAAAARAYIAWETGLVDRLDAQERGRFDPG